MKRLKKRKKKFQKSKKASVATTSRLSKDNKPSPVLTSPLELLAEKRKGGAESIKGFVFQCRYAALKILTHLEPPKTSEERFVRLEGIEDIDVFKVATERDYSEFIQVKSSKNQMDAGQFWGKHHILQNFTEVYISNPKSRFRLVHNMDFSKGHLSRLNQSCTNREPLSAKDLEHWNNKFAELQNRQKQADKNEVWDWASFDLSEFFKRITFEKTIDNDLSEKIRRRIIAKYSITEGNEAQYMRALCWHVLLWSKDKAVIRWEDVIKIIQEVKDDIARGASNPAVQNRWQSPVSFEVSEKESCYFEGKPARPQDIAAGLPARRPDWKRQILETFKQADVTVIRASSGQGKSTLAWQAALHLVGQGWRPYELHWCADAREIGNIITFIESRIKIGEMPLIVIDGLGQAVSEWGELAKRTEELPVKYIITAREEDWYRYGADRSRLRIIPVSIEMNRGEAGDIHAQFKKAEKLESDGLKWQTAWEQVQKRGLLIEYVYLLTHGAMMEERLSCQIRAIADEKNAAEKLEILRLVSVADLCGVKLPSLALIESLNERIGFQSDRGETLKSIEREYQILIKNLDYAEGLHPVRSRHLAAILHETLPMVHTLINILAVIEPDSLYEFCAHAPLLIDGKHRVLFLEKLAQRMAEWPYGDMVRVIDGLFATDAKQHWQVNKEIFDDLASKGLMSELIILIAFPWSSIDFFEGLEKDSEFKQALEAFKKYIDRMIPFDPVISDTFTFIKSLSNYLIQQEMTDDFKTFGRLTQWFLRFGLRFPLLKNVDEPMLWQAFNTLELEDTGELFDAYNSAYPEKYQVFFEKNTSKITGLLKRRTNTLTIVGKETILGIKYLFDHDNESININDESVKRAKILSSVLPQYNEYHTNAIYPPIPGLDYYIDEVDDSEKRMPKKNVGNKFSVHVNRIWIDSIMVNYESASVYEWQEQWYDIRTKSLDLASGCIRLIEAELEGKNRKKSIIANKLDRIRPELLRLLTTVKAFPKKGEAFLNSKKFDRPFKTFSEWSFAWRNFIEKLLWLFKGNDHQRNLANVNIQDTRRKLSDMQHAFQTIMENTTPYFNMQKLKEKETVAYNRLAKTVDFYLSNWNQIGKVSNVRFSVANWWKKQERKRIYEVKKALSELEAVSDFRFIAPQRTVENGVLLETAIGVHGLQLSQMPQRNLIALFVGLSGLADVDIDYYHLVGIENDVTVNSRAIRLHKDILKRVKKIIESGDESVDLGLSKPHLVPIGKALLETLPGITMGKEPEKDVIKTSQSSILIQLWRLSEIRKRLSREETTENAWRQELEKGCKQVIDDQMKVIEQEAGEDIFGKYQRLIEDVTKNNHPFTSDDFQRNFSTCTGAISDIEKP